MDTDVSFDELVTSHRRELYAHCYRMLGSVHDAEDALQDALLGAWRGLPTFEGRSSARAWLYRISTNACLKLIARRPRRVLSPDHGPARTGTDDLGQPVPGPIWLEPWPDDPAADLPADPHDTDPAARYLRRETVELAFIAALQHLPATQRAVLILREVLQYSAAETAELLDTTTASVNSALQRARRTLDQKLPATSQHAELSALGETGRRDLVDTFVTAWEHADLPTLLDLLTQDARFTMPPLPAWFDGRDQVARFLADRVFATAWRLRPLPANGQPGFACYTATPDGAFRLGAINVLTLRDGRIAEITGFLDPALHQHLRLPAELPENWPPTHR